MGISLPVIGVPDLYGGDFLSFTITTVAPMSSATFQRITPTGGTCTVNWNDGWGSQTVVADGETGTTAHLYPDIGTYHVTISNYDIITYLDIRDAQIGCIAGTIGELTALTDLTLIGVAGVTVGAGEIGVLLSLTNLRLTSFAGVTVGAGEIGGLTLLLSLWLSDVANVTVGAGEIDNLINLTTLFLFQVANVTMGAAETGSLTLLTSLTLVNSDNIAAQTGIGSLPALVALRYENELTEANVDMVLASLYAAFPARTGANGTIDLLGDSNAAPSGVSPGGAECAPADGYNTAYELVNDSCLVADNHWAGVTVA